MTIRRNVVIGALLLATLFLTLAPVARSEHAPPEALTQSGGRFAVPEPVARVWPIAPPAPDLPCLDPGCAVTVRQLSRPYDWYRWQGDPSGGTGYGACMFANKLCGAACASMAIAYARYGQQVSLRELHQAIKPGGGCTDYWTWPDIAGAFQTRRWEVPFSLLDLTPGMPELVAAIDRGHPCIVALRAGALPVAEGDSWVGRYYSYGSGHILMVMGYTWDRAGDSLAHVIVYDPLVFDDPPYWAGAHPKGLGRLYDAEAFWHAVRSYATLMFEIEHDPAPRLTGEVVDAETGRGVSGADVRVTDATGATHTAVTDARGRYAVGYAADGEIVIRVQHDRAGATARAVVPTGQALAVPSIRLIVPRTDDAAPLPRCAQCLVRDAW